jgi:transcription antitermination protein NusB
VRRLARTSALQALYELDTTSHPADQAIAYRLADAPLPAEGEAFLRILVSGVLKNRAQLDAMIQHYAPAWPVSQIAIVDRNILRIALFELTATPKTPPKVAINEAVDLAKAFGSDSSSRFVNGVLGTAVAHLGLVLEAGCRMPDTESSLLEAGAEEPDSRPWAAEGGQDADEEQIDAALAREEE